MKNQKSAPAGRAEIGPDGTLTRCPQCGGRDFQCVSDGELTNFLCLTCGCCWHLELGWVHRVDPVHLPRMRVAPHLPGQQGTAPGQGRRLTATLRATKPGASWLVSFEHGVRTVFAPLAPPAQRAEAG